MEKLEQEGKFLYACVAKSGTVMARFPIDDDLSRSCAKVLPKVDNSIPILVIEQKDTIWTALVEQDGLVFLSACEKAVKARECNNFLSSLKAEWLKAYGPSTFKENEKDDEFGTQIQLLLSKFNQGRIPSPEPVQAAAPPEPSQSEPLISNESESGKINFDIGDDAQEEPSPELRTMVFCRRHKAAFVVSLLMAIIIFALISVVCGGVRWNNCL